MQRMSALNRWVPFVSLLAAIVWVTYYQLSFHDSDKEAAYTVERTVKYSFTLKNPNSYPVKSAQLWAYIPIRKSTFQQLDSLTTSHPYRLIQDERGNERIQFVIENLPPYASRTITVTASLKLSEQSNRIETIQSEAFLADEELIGLSTPAVQRIASRMQADTPRDTADRIYNWITRNIKKSGYIRHDMGAPQALESKSGDCTEFMYLFSALARANGLPTRNMAGFVATENRVLRPADYHNWNEVFIDGAWYLVDTDKQVFMEKSADYIAMRQISDASISRPMDSQSFFSSTDEIQVSMN